VAEQRVAGAVGDAKDRLQARQSGALGGAGMDGNGDGYTATVCFMWSDKPTNSFNPLPIYWCWAEDTAMLRSTASCTAPRDALSVSCPVGVSTGVSADRLYGFERFILQSLQSNDIKAAFEREGHLHYEAERWR
jgi:hypothetical protein